MKESHHRRRLQDLVLLSDTYKEPLQSIFYNEEKITQSNLSWKIFPLRSRPGKRWFDAHFPWCLVDWYPFKMSVVCVIFLSRSIWLCFWLWTVCFWFQYLSLSFNENFVLFKFFCRVCIRKISSIQLILNLTCWKDSWLPWVLPANRLPKRYFVNT